MSLGQRSADTSVHESIHSMHGDAHDEEMEEVFQEGVNVPLPSSPSLVSNKHGRPGSRQSSGTSTWKYVVAPLPQQTLLYSTGSPLLYHYRMIDGAAIDPVHRYCAPTAAKSMYICKDEELLARKTDFLHVFAECFPAEAQRYGQTFYIKSFIYDLFPGLEKRVDDTLLAIPVSFRTGESETVGYFIDSKAYIGLW